MFHEVGAVFTQKYGDYHFAQLPDQDAPARVGNRSEGWQLLVYDTAGKIVHLSSFKTYSNDAV